MRKSTREKLFTSDEHFYVTLETGELELGGFVTFISFNSNSYIVHDYPDEKDGFQVYKMFGGNSINGTRREMGLPAKVFTSEVEG